MANVPFNPNLSKLPVYQPGRPIEEVSRELGICETELAKLASNENPLGPSPKALEAMANALPYVNQYPDGNCYYLKNRLGEKLDLGSEQIIIGNGSNDILELIGHAFLQPGDEVVISEFSFIVYTIVARLFGASLVTIPAVRYGHDLNAMLEGVTAKTKIMFVANPNNPTGTLCEKADLMQLVNNLPGHVLLVMDEAYIEFLADPVDFLAMIRDKLNDRLILTRTFSKIYGLAGLRIGYGISNERIIKALNQVREPFNVNAIAQAGALAALEDNDHLTQTRRINNEGLDYFQKQLTRLKIPFVSPYANFILANVGEGAIVFQKLQKLGIIARPVGAYGLPEWLRISIGTSTQNQQCLNALETLLDCETN
ncbi:MAG TPA: histidinol-phosphate transaminase [Verrucomicrobiales bacterium]|jgi:histidinol-phosphate aminotransferase|nr:histidinol-phosphate transaminase [Verrucomicrobiales bacterium]HIL70764.1 histidinol-phosphate transaminase [Verrucomicrobiota bacterium]